MTDDLAPGELRILVAVADAGSFSAAGARLGLTQPAISRAVRASERRIGTRLFERGRNGARATPAGAAAVVHARSVLRLLDVLRADALAAAGAAPPSTLRVAAFRSAAVHLLPPVLARVRARHPGVTCDVAIVRELGPGAAGEVAAGRADVAIVNLPHRAGRTAGLVEGRIAQEPYLLLHPRGAADVRRLPFVDWDENCSADTRRWFSAQDWLPPATITVADDSVLLSMVAHGMGMAVVPRLTAAGRPAAVAARDLGPDAPTRTIGYVTTAALARSAVVRTLIRELRRT
ncbi:LysR family transcriptional regulator [Dactylosporangium sp. NPDC005572]|uniref:LysR family transcriptional regulator n=1 Tax=Dactylosporangium sp. NPDC005572 TaxID=3156889 RepID=UPI0033A1128B